MGEAIASIHGGQCEASYAVPYHWKTFRACDEMDQVVAAATSLGDSRLVQSVRGPHPACGGVDPSWMTA